MSDAKVRGIARIFRDWYIGSGGLSQGGPGGDASRDFFVPFFFSIPIRELVGIILIFGKLLEREAARDPIHLKIRAFRWNTWFAYWNPISYPNFAMQIDKFRRYVYFPACVYSILKKIERTWGRLGRPYFGQIWEIIQLLGIGLELGLRFPKLDTTRAPSINFRRIVR